MNDVGTTARVAEVDRRIRQLWFAQQRLLRTPEHGGRCTEERVDGVFQLVMPDEDRAALDELYAQERELRIEREQLLSDRDDFARECADESEAAE